jgi:hypothetical protein
MNFINFKTESHQLPEFPDMSTDKYENAKIKCLNEVSSVNISDIEQKTRGQNSNPEWYREQSFRLMVSKFGKICKMRLNTDTANTVNEILYSERSSTRNSVPKPLLHGMQNEEKVKEKFRT